MTLHVLQEMLELSEAGGSIVDRFKAGYQDAKTRQTTAVNKIKGADRRAVDVRAKADLQAVSDDVSEFVQNFFTQFPTYDGAGSANDILQKYPNRPTRDAGINAFKALAKRVDTLRTGLNKSLVSSDMVDPRHAARFEAQAKRMMGANPPPLPASLIRFVKKEAGFFKKLIRIKNNAELDDNNFKEMLQLKIKQTVGERVPDAAQALNMLFGYMVVKFKDQARVIADANAASEDEERRARMSNRGTPPPEDTE